MKQQESEYKVLLTPAQAHAIAAAYAFATPFHQTNTYYDTATGALHQLGLGLRIRQFATHAEQTLKVPTSGPRTLTELTDPLTVTQAATLIAQRTLAHPGVVATALAERAIPLASVHPFAHATTTRQLAPQAEGLLTLDATCYANGTHDFELEFEFSDPAQAAPFFSALLTRFAITPAPPENKVTRAVHNVN
ncbi:CYTH domain-containing protein [Lacticaseibacillus daqingensis]|uniref:CYTH domain-containing protein n=1 Tax=Lacticaseibacillus daqingensis TaxID=2486014 RepID=UPI000F7BA3B1|nr:CYTH domain-containing protein [Lacticaseibacillus daqingensis]